MKEEPRCFLSSSLGNRSEGKVIYFFLKQQIFHVKPKFIKVTNGLVTFPGEDNALFEFFSAIAYAVMSILERLTEF